LEQTHSDLVEIAKRNGDFQKNYGILIGAFLYLRSLSAACPRFSWVWPICALLSVTLPWLAKLAWRSP